MRLPEIPSVYLLIFDEMGLLPTTNAGASPVLFGRVSGQASSNLSLSFAVLEKERRP